MKFSLIFVLCLGYILCCLSVSYGQNLPRERNYNFVSLWGGLGGMKGSRADAGVWYGQLQSSSITLTQMDSGVKFTEFYSLHLGHEKNLSKTWLIGGMVQYHVAPGQSDNPSTVRPRVYAGHVSPKNFIFEKYIAMEAVVQTKPSIFFSNYLRGRMSLVLGKSYELSDNACLVPTLSYEIFKNLTSPFKTDIESRFIADTRFKINLMYQNKKGYNVNLFLADAINYYIAEAEYDADNKETRPRRAVNNHFFVVGVGVNWLLNTASSENRFVYGIN